MIDSEQYITEQFHESIAAKMAAAEEISGDLAELADFLAHILVHNGKVFTCGNGESAVIAQQLSLALAHRLERDRPALPTFSLNQDALALSSIATSDRPHDIYARQIRGLATEKDALLIITQDDDSPSLSEAINAARERGMHIIVLGGPELGELEALLEDDDFDIRVPIEPSPRLSEVHLLSITCIVELIEAHIFGVDL